LIDGLSAKQISQGLSKSFGASPFPFIKSINTTFHIITTEAHIPEFSYGS
jgi:hypothetical protein